MENYPHPAPDFNGRSRRVDLNSPFDWLKQGWAYFVANPTVWVVMTLLLMVIMVALSSVPFVGTLAGQFLTPVFGAGLMIASRKFADGGTAEIVDLFAAFKDRRAGDLMTLGLLYMAGMLVVVVVGMALGGGSIASGMMMAHPAGFGLALGGMMVAALVSAALCIPLFMAIWFAPALVVFNGMRPVDACKASLGACVQNAVPFIIYGLITLVLSFFAALPVGLGFLILVPVLSGSVYASYRDIFLAN